jgi:NAD(P)-dependent dehydrogenase (short-subunit alcohol dehydrogenase family)
MKKTVLITGCSTGFGKDAALHFAQQGWNVIATLRRVEDGKELIVHENILVARLDVQDKTSIDTAITSGIDRFGAIDVLVNNAGFGLFGVFESTSEEKIQEQFAVNVFGVMDVTRAILPHMRERKAGVIINVSSGAGIFTLPMLSLYCSSKFALEGFSEGLSYELLGLGIVVKVVEPGGVVSTDFRKRSASEAEKTSEIADYVQFKASTQKVFASLRSARLATVADVSKVVFKAATDGTDTLRYVATNDILPLVNSRRTAGEDAYIAMMRKSFLQLQ